MKDGSVTSREITAPQVMKSNTNADKTGGKGLVGKHKSDMEESEEQEDLEMILQKNDKEKG